MDVNIVMQTIARKVFPKTVNYDVNSPLLCGKISENDKITERKVKSLKEKQLTIWEI